MVHAGCAWIFCAEVDVGVALSVLQASKPNALTTNAIKISCLITISNKIQVGTLSQNSQKRLWHYIADRDGNTYLH